MMAPLIVGAGLGVGLLAAAWALVPPRSDLAAAVGHMDSARAHVRPVGVGEDGRRWKTRLGRRLTSAALNRGWTMPTLRSDLALLDRSVELHLTAKVLSAASALIAPVVFIAILTAGGVHVGWTIPVIVGVAMAVAASFLPDLAVAQAANARRGELRRALAIYLDLVSMALAGGRGIPEALPGAAQIGRGWGFELIADTLATARYSGVTTWDALRDLGDRVNVPELRDLGNAVNLVSDDGAKIRESLRARAATARARQLAEAEGSADRASESISHAHMLLGFSFLVFLGFPAIAAVMAI